MKGNDAVGELARKGAGTPVDEPETFCGNVFTATTLRSEEGRLRELNWANLPRMEQSRVLMREWNQALEILFKPYKKSLRIIVRIPTDHCELNNQLDKLEIFADTISRLCEENGETHVLGKCPALLQRD